MRETHRLIAGIMLTYVLAGPAAHAAKTRTSDCMRLSIAATPALGVAIASAAVAVENAYFPIDDGRRWHFRSGSGATTTMEIVGPDELNGNPTILMRITEGDETLDVHWSVADDGTVHYHGARSETDGTTWMVPPPPIFTPTPMLGDHVVTPIQFFDDGVLAFAGTVTSRIVEAGSVSVPAGTFDGLRWEFTLANARGSHTLRRALGVKPWWIAEGIGTIVYAGVDERFDLESFELPVSDSSWSRIKDLYAR